MGAHYDEGYHMVISAGGEGFAEVRWREQKELIYRYKRGGAILDIGCSSGGFLGTMRNGDWKLHGIEITAATADKAKSATGAEVFVGDAVDAPFGLESFDVVTCFDVLEHVYEPRKFLAKVLDWLKPSGIFYAILPNIDSWEARAFRSYWYGLELPRHLYHFSPRSLRRLMASLGFEEVRLGTPPTSYVERSIGYLCASAIEAAGLKATPQSEPTPLGVPGRIARKVWRTLGITPFGTIASLAGAGASIQAIFAKPASTPLSSRRSL
jgi:SAM-dependent methyltransferase